RAGEPPSQRAGAGGREAHRDEPLRDRPRTPVLAHRLGREPLAAVRRHRREVDAVRQGAVAREGPEQRPRGGLAAAELPRHQRQQRDSDHRATLYSAVTGAAYTCPMSEGPAEGPADVAALFARLKEEIRAAGPRDGVTPAQVRLSVRDQAERL